MGLLDPINPLGEIAVDVLVCGLTVSGRCPPRKALRTAGRSPFTVAVDREDDLRVTRTVLAAHHAVAGRVVVHPTVGGGDRLLWHDVLYAVAEGHRLRALACAARGSLHEQERAAGAALRATGVRQMTVLRAHRIGLGLWADLMHLHPPHHPHGCGRGAPCRTARGSGPSAAALRPPHHRHPCRRAGAASACGGGTTRLTRSPACQGWRPYAPADSRPCSDGGGRHGR